MKLIASAATLEASQPKTAEDQGTGHARPQMDFFFSLFNLLNSQTALRMKLQTSRTKNVFWCKIQMCLVRSLLVSHVLLLTVFLLFDRQLRQERKQTTLLKESGKG